jgi:hypothetical protein
MLASTPKIIAYYVSLLKKLVTVPFILFIFSKLAFFFFPFFVSYKFVLFLKSFHPQFFFFFIKVVF